MPDPGKGPWDCSFTYASISLVVLYLLVLVFVARYFAKLVVR